MESSLLMDQSVVFKRVTGISARGGTSKIFHFNRAETYDEEYRVHCAVRGVTDGRRGRQRIGAGDEGTHEKADSESGGASERGQDRRSRRTENGARCRAGRQGAI